MKMVDPFISEGIAEPLRKRKSTNSLSFAIQQPIQQARIDARLETSCNNQIQHHIEEVFTDRVELQLKSQTSEIPEDYVIMSA